MESMVFEKPSNYEVKVTRVYKLDDAIKTFDIGYGVSTPSISGLAFGIINACIAAKFDEKFGYIFRSGHSYRHVEITLDTEDAATQFKDQMKDLASKHADEVMKMAIIYTDNYNPTHLISGFEYDNLCNDTYVSIFYMIYMITEIIRSAVIDFESIENLSDVIYRSGDNNISIRIYKNTNVKRYTLYIFAFTDK